MKQDITTKILEEYSDIFADIGNVNLYGGKQVISPDDLELLPSKLSYQDLQGKHRELRPDVRMKVKKQGWRLPSYVQRIRPEFVIQCPSETWDMNMPAIRNRFER